MKWYEKLFGRQSQGPLIVNDTKLQPDYPGGPLIVNDTKLRRGLPRGQEVKNEPTVGGAPVVADSPVGPVGSVPVAKVPVGGGYDNGYAYNQGHIDYDLREH